jgi:predicted RNase H-like HicB family nuclease
MKTLSPDQRVTDSIGTVVAVNWRDPPTAYHEFVAIACPEEDGGYSVFAPNYPDVISQGDTLDEVRVNIGEAFLAVLESRRKHGEEMRHTPSASIDVPRNCEHLRITVDG